MNAVPSQSVQNVRNDMYFVSEALRRLGKNNEGSFDPSEWASLHEFKSLLNDATKYIPSWVKIAVAIALGLGTMVGWRRIVITVGERIGKQASDLRAGCVGRASRNGDDWRCRRLRPSRLNHAGTLFRCRRNHGSQWIRAAMGHRAQSSARLGTYFAGGHCAIRPALCLAPPYFLGRCSGPPRAGALPRRHTRIPRGPLGAPNGSRSHRGKSTCSCMTCTASRIEVSAPASPQGGRSSC